MSDANPYAAPEEANPAATESTDTIGGLQIASQNRRFLNYIIDTIVVQVGSTVAGGILGASAVAASGGAGLTPNEAAELQFKAFFLGLGLFIGYYILMEAAFGLTIGKLLTGTKIIRDDGSSAGFGQVVGRSFARMIPFEPLSFLFGDKTTGWHDSLTGTRVVMTR